MNLQGLSPDLPPQPTLPFGMGNDEQRMQEADRQLGDTQTMEKIMSGSLLLGDNPQGNFAAVDNHGGLLPEDRMQQLMASKMDFERAQKADEVSTAYRQGGTEYEAWFAGEEDAKTRAANFLQHQENLKNIAMEWAKAGKPWVAQEIEGSATAAWIGAEASQRTNYAEYSQEDMDAIYPVLPHERWLELDTTDPSLPTQVDHAVASAALQYVGERPGSGFPDTPEVEALLNQDPRFKHGRPREVARNAINAWKDLSLAKAERAEDQIKVVPLGVYRQVDGNLYHKGGVNKAPEMQIRDFYDPVAGGRSVEVTLPGGKKITESVAFKDRDTAMGEIQRRDKAEMDGARRLVASLRELRAKDEAGFLEAYGFIARRGASSNKTRGVLNAMLEFGFADAESIAAARGGEGREDLMKKGLDAYNQTELEIMPGMLAKTLEQMTVDFEAHLAEMAALGEASKEPVQGEYQINRRDALRRIVTANRDVIPETQNGELDSFMNSMLKSGVDGARFLIEGLTGMADAAKFGSIDPDYIKTKKMQAAAANPESKADYIKMASESMAWLSESLSQSGAAPRDVALGAVGVDTKKLPIDWSSVTRAALPEVAQILATTGLATKANRFLRKTVPDMKVLSPVADLESKIATAGAGAKIEKAREAMAAGKIPSQKMQDAIKTAAAGDQNVAAAITSVFTSGRAGIGVRDELVKLGVPEDEANMLMYASFASNLALEYPMNLLHIKALTPTTAEFRRATAKAAISKGIENGQLATLAASRKITGILQGFGSIGFGGLSEGATEAMQFAADRLIANMAVRGLPEFDGWDAEAAAGLLMGVFTRGFGTAKNAGLNASSANPANISADVAAIEGIRAEAAEVAKRQAMLADIEGQDAAAKGVGENSNPTPLQPGDVVANDVALYKKDSTEIEGSGEILALPVLSVQDGKFEVEIDGERKWLTTNELSGFYRDPQAARSVPKAKLEAEAEIADAEAAAAALSEQEMEQYQADAVTAADALVKSVARYGDAPGIAIGMDSDTEYNTETGQVVVGVRGLAEALAEKRARQGGELTPETVEAIADIQLDEELRHAAHDYSIREWVSFLGETKDEGVVKKGRDAYLTEVYNQMTIQSPEAVAEGAAAYTTPENWEQMTPVQKAMEIARQASQIQDKNIGKPTEMVTGFFSTTFDALTKVAMSSKNSVIRGEAIMIGQAHKAYVLNSGLTDDEKEAFLQEQDRKIGELLSMDRPDLRRMLEGDDTIELEEDPVAETSEEKVAGASKPERQNRLGKHWGGIVTSEAALFGGSLTKEQREAWHGRRDQLVKQATDLAHRLAGQGRFVTPGEAAYMVLNNGRPAPFAISTSRMLRALEMQAALETLPELLGVKKKDMARRIHMAQAMAGEMRPAEKKVVKGFSGGRDKAIDAAGEKALKDKREINKERINSPNETDVAPISFKTRLPMIDYSMVVPDSKLTKKARELRKVMRETRTIISTMDRGNVVQGMSLKKAEEIHEQAKQEFIKEMKAANLGLFKADVAIAHGKDAPPVTIRNVTKEFTKNGKRDTFESEVVVVSEEGAAAIRSALDGKGLRVFDEMDEGQMVHAAITALVASSASGNDAKEILFRAGENATPEATASFNARQQAVADQAMVEAKSIQDPEAKMAAVAAAERLAAAVKPLSEREAGVAMFGQRAARAMADHLARGLQEGATIYGTARRVMPVYIDGFRGGVRFGNGLLPVLDIAEAMEQVLPLGRVGDADLDGLIELFVRRKAKRPLGMELVSNMGTGLAKVKTAIIRGIDAKAFDSEEAYTEWHKAEVKNTQLTGEDLNRIRMLSPALGAIAKARGAYAAKHGGLLEELDPELVAKDDGAWTVDGENREWDTLRGAVIDSLLAIFDYNIRPDDFSPTKYIQSLLDPSHMPSILTDSDATVRILETLIPKSDKHVSVLEEAVRDVMKIRLLKATDDSKARKSKQKVLKNLWVGADNDLRNEREWNEGAKVDLPLFSDTGESARQRVMELAGFERGAVGYGELYEMVGNWLASGRLGISDGLDMMGMISRHHVSVIKALRDMDAPYAGEEDADPNDDSKNSRNFQQHIEQAKARERSRMERMAEAASAVYEKVRGSEEHAKVLREDVFEELAYNSRDKAYWRERFQYTGWEAAMSGLRRVPVKSKDQKQRYRYVEDPEYLMAFVRMANRRAKADENYVLLELKSLKGFLTHYVEPGAKIVLSGNESRRDRIAGVYRTPPIARHIETKSPAAVLAAINMTRKSGNEFSASMVRLLGDLIDYAPNGRPYAMFVQTEDSLIWHGLPNGPVMLDDGKFPIIYHRQYVASALTDPNQEKVQEAFNRITLHSILAAQVEAHPKAFARLVKSFADAVHELRTDNDESRDARGRFLKGGAPSTFAGNGAAQFKKLIETVPSGRSIFFDPAAFLTELMINPTFRKAVDLMAIQPSDNWTIGDMDKADWFLAGASPYSLAPGDAAPMGGLRTVIASVINMMGRAGGNWNKQMVAEISAATERSQLAATHAKQEADAVHFYNSHAEADNEMLTRILDRAEASEIQPAVEWAKSVRSMAVEEPGGDAFYYPLSQIARFPELTQADLEKLQTSGWGKDLDEFDSLTKLGKHNQLANRLRAQMRRYIKHNVTGSSMSAWERMLAIAGEEDIPKSTFSSTSKIEDGVSGELENDGAEATLSPSGEAALMATERELRIARSGSVGASRPIGKAAAGMAMAFGALAGKLPAVAMMVGGRSWNKLTGYERETAEKRAKGLGMASMIAAMQNQIRPNRLNAYTLKLGWTAHGAQMSNQWGIDRANFAGVKEDPQLQIKMDDVFAQIQQLILDGSENTLGSLNPAQAQSLSYALLRAGKLGSTGPLIGWYYRNWIPELISRAEVGNLLGSLSPKRWDWATTRGMGPFTHEDAFIDHTARSKVARDALQRVAGIMHFGIEGLPMNGRNYQATLDRYIERLTQASKGLEGMDMTKAYWVGMLASIPKTTGGDDLSLLDNYHTAFERVGIAFAGLAGATSRTLVYKELKERGMLEGPSEMDAMIAFEKQLAEGDGKTNKGLVAWKIGYGDILVQRKAGIPVDTRMVKALLDQAATMGQWILTPEQTRWLKTSREIFRELYPLANAANFMARGEKLGEFESYTSAIPWDATKGVAASGVYDIALDPLRRSVQKARVTEAEQLKNMLNRITHGEGGYVLRGEDAVRLGIERTLMFTHGSTSSIVLDGLLGTAEGPGALSAKAKEGLVLGNWVKNRNGETDADLAGLAYEVDLVAQSLAAAFHSAKQAEIMGRAIPSQIRAFMFSAGKIGTKLALAGPIQIVKQTVPAIIAAASAAKSMNHSMAVFDLFRHLMSSAASDKFGGGEFGEAVLAFLEATDQQIAQRGGDMAEWLISQRAARRQTSATRKTDMVRRTIGAPLRTGGEVSAWWNRLFVGKPDGFATQILWIANMMAEKGVDTSSPQAMMDFMASYLPTTEEIRTTSREVEVLMGGSDRSRRAQILRPMGSELGTMFQISALTYSSMAISLRASAGAAIHKLSSADPEFRQEGMRELSQIFIQQSIFHAMSGKIVGGIAAKLGAIAGPIGAMIAQFVFGGEPEDKKLTLSTDLMDDNNAVAIWYRRMLGDALIVSPVVGRFTSLLGALSITPIGSGLYNRGLAELGLIPLPREFGGLFPESPVLNFIHEHIPTSTVTPFIEQILKFSAATFDTKRKRQRWTPAAKTLAVANVLASLYGWRELSNQLMSEYLDERKPNRPPPKPKKAHKTVWDRIGF